jgi:hypothetical protein
LVRTALAEESDANPILIVEIRGECAPYVLAVLQRRRDGPGTLTSGQSRLGESKW